MKANHAAVLVLFVAGALAAFNLLGQGTSKAPQPRWEYWLIEGHRAYFPLVIGLILRGFPKRVNCRSRRA